MEEYRPKGWRGCLVFVVFIGIVITGCMMSVYVGIDVVCSNSAHTWLPDYPGATLINQEHNFIRPFGIGETTRALYSPEARRAVELWYMRHDADNVSQGRTRDGGMATMRWFLQEDDTRGGTLITLYSSCAADLIIP